MKKQAAFGWQQVARGIALVMGIAVTGYAAVDGVVALARGVFSWNTLVWGVLVDAVTLVLLGALASLVSLVAGRKRENIFLTLSNAMKRIGQGDFDVNLSMESHERDGGMGQVVSGLKEMAESLKRVEAMRQEFVSDVSHEIQSPLTSIAGFTRALRDEELPAAQRSHYLDIIESESQRLSRLSDSLLRLSALDSKAQAMTPSSYRLDAQLRAVVLSCESQWRTRRLDVTADLVPLSVTADQSMMAQVWGNLLHNAVKFTPAGGAIRVSLAEADRHAVVRVTDSGIGIQADDLPLVFDRFFKADKSRTVANGAGGSGLGLSIAQRIVLLHGGTITAESDGMDRGSTFTVRIPLG